MNKYLRPLFLILIGFNLYLAAWSVLHQDLFFGSDIARDFFIFQEIQQKHFILIGERSGALGFFHGPLWAYINTPAFILGKGNPIVVGWFWVVLIAFFCAVNFWLAKKLFNETAAWLFTLMFSLYSASRAWALFNPDGAYFVVPLFFFLFINYIKTHKLRYLAAQILVNGMIFQCQIAVGMPLAILSFIYILYDSIKNKHIKHLFAFGLWVVPFSTYLLFEIRHNFTLIHSGLRQLGQHDSQHTLFQHIGNRLQVLSTGPDFFRYNFNNFNWLISLIFLLFLIYEIKNNQKLRQIYLFFLYFYCGFFVLTLLNRYFLLYFYVFPLYPLAFLIFSSLVSAKSKYLFILLFIFVYLANLAGTIKEHNSPLITDFPGKNQYSWKGLLNVASYVFNQPEKDFGYFVFSPDQIAYEGRYAMEYGRQYFQSNAASFEKKPVTFIIAAPENDTYISAKWWVQNQIKITSEPVEIIKMENDYTVEKYLLSEEEIKAPINSDANPGLHFR